MRDNDNADVLFGKEWRVPKRTAARPANAIALIVWSPEYD